MNSQGGFSLVEALVALSVLALAAAGLIGATEVHLGQLRALEVRAVAQFVAENRLVELRLASAVPQRGITSEDMLDHAWNVEVIPRSTDDPDLVAVDIAVMEAGSRSPAVTLAGFVDVGGISR